MADPVPNTAAPAPSGAEHSVEHAASLIEGLLGPAPADKPKKPASAAVEAPAEEPDDAPEETEAATQPAEGEAEAEEQPSSDDESEAQSEPAEKAPLEIEVALPDGSTSKVKLDELKNGYLRQSDYTRKTQAHAENVKAFDAQVQQVSQVVKAKLDTLQAELDRLIPSEKSIDWDGLHQRDPAEYVKWKEYFRDLKDKRQAVAQEQAQIQFQAQQRAERETAETLKRESEALAKALPVFADPKKGDAAKAELRSYLIGKGYTAEQIAGLSDHRSVTIAWKAAQYDKLQAAKPTVEKRVVNLPRVQKPGAALDGEHVSRQKQTSLEMKLRKTGRVEDAAALILSRMN
jgi:hypothetical protein